MGQYYRVATIDKNGERKFYNREVDGQYTMAKLMEHSWWENPFVSCITKFLYKNPLTIAWVGDYATDDAAFAGKRTECVSMLDDIYQKTWGEGSEAIGVTLDEISLDGKYLVNHTLKMYVDCDAYREKSSMEGEFAGWVIHPIPLLTAIGNGCGGGDYWGENQDIVGTWALCEISVEDEAPSDYTELDVSFRE